MVGADESSELWRHPYIGNYLPGQHVAKRRQNAMQNCKKKSYKIENEITHANLTSKRDSKL